MIIRNNTLYFGVYNAYELAERYGTPLYIYEESVIHDLYQQIKSSFAYTPFQIHYAVMANNRHEILRIFKQFGASVQVNSPKELHEALRAGFDTSKVSVTTTNISMHDLALYVRYRVMVNLDSQEELHKLCQLVQHKNLKGMKAGIRCHIDQSPPSLKRHSLDHKGNRVGVMKRDIDNIVAHARTYGVALTSLHGYLGTNIMEVRLFIRMAECLATLIPLLPDIHSVNIGGGFGVTTRDDKREFDFRTLGAHLKRLMERASRSVGRKIQLKIEPGRTLIAKAGTLLSTVTNVKAMEGWTQVGCDGGFGIFPRPYVYGWRGDGYHPILLARNPRGKNHGRYTIGANTVLQNDIIGEDRQLPRVQEGDILAIKNVGAYGAVMTSGFPGKNLPNEILIKKGGKIIKL